MFTESDSWGDIMLSQEKVDAVTDEEWLSLVKEQLPALETKDYIYSSVEFEVGHYMLGYIYNSIENYIEDIEFYDKNFQMADLHFEQTCDDKYDLLSILIFRGKPFMIVANYSESAQVVSVLDKALLPELEELFKAVIGDYIKDRGRMW